MRAIASAALLLTACATLGACASASDNAYISDQKRLADECTARGGILQATGQTTGRVETENVCRINGEPARAGRSY